MSSPFAPSPKLREYCEWARTEGGCEISDCLFDLKSYVKINAPNRRPVFQPNRSNDEPLCHAEVASLDRRLGLDSPFPKTPEEPE